MWFSCRVFADSVRNEGLLLDFRVDKIRFYTLQSEEEKLLAALLADRLPKHPLILPLQMIVLAVDSVSDGSGELVEIDRPAPSPAVPTVESAADLDRADSEENVAADAVRFDTGSQAETVYAVNYPAPVVYWNAPRSLGTELWTVPYYGSSSSCCRRGPTCSHRPAVYTSHRCSSRCRHEQQDRYWTDGRDSKREKNHRPASIPVTVEPTKRTVTLSDWQRRATAKRNGANPEPDVPGPRKPVAEVSAEGRFCRGLRPSCAYDLDSCLKNPETQRSGALTLPAAGNPMMSFLLCARGFPW